MHVFCAALFALIRADDKAVLLSLRDEAPKTLRPLYLALFKFDAYFKSCRNWLREGRCVSEPLQWQREAAGRHAFEMLCEAREALEACDLPACEALLAFIDGQAPAVRGMPAAPVLARSAQPAPPPTAAPRPRRRARKAKAVSESERLQEAVGWLKRNLRADELALIRRHAKRLPSLL